MDLFLLYLILKFAKESEHAEVKDAMLNRKVPCLVFIMN